MASPISNQQAMNDLSPWFDLFGEVFEAAQRDHFAAISLLGVPRKTERAGELHRACRENFRRVCDTAAPLLELKEEPDGQGLDYLISRLGQPLAVRLGFYKNGAIKRNRTDRTRTCQEQNILFPDCDLDEHVQDMPLLTLGYTISNDYTEVGVPCWFISKLLLLRERTGESEVITTIREFSEPKRNAGNYTAPSAIIKARQAELAQWEQMVRRIKKSAG